MTTVLPSEPDDPGAPLRSAEELVEWFAAGEKARDRFRVGTEHEKFGFLVENHAPLPFAGPQGIEAVFDALCATGAPWQRAYDGSRTVALFWAGPSAQERGTSEDGVWRSPVQRSITLEPGGQFELSGAPLRTIHETERELAVHLEELRDACAPLGVDFVGIGFHPTATLDELPLVPKARYGVMTRYMPRVGSRGLDMMKRTATVQANYDWSDERDLARKARASLSVAPLVTALFASSPFFERRASGALSERHRVWADTDPARAGFPDVMLRGFSYARYVDWALSVPMYFVRREGQHHDVAGASFRDFMTDGLLVGGERVRATLRDWSDHLTTLFPEVRIKRVLEVRSADSGPRDHILALPALYKGLLYDERALDDVLALMDGVTAEELRLLRDDAALRGFQAEWRGERLLGRCARLVDIARCGLERIGDRDDSGRDEARHLRPLVERVARGETYAERLLRRARSAWGGDVDRLWDELSLLHEHPDEGTAFP